MWAFTIVRFVLNPGFVITLFQQLFAFGCISTEPGNGSFEYQYQCLMISGGGVGRTGPAGDGSIIDLLYHDYSSVVPLKEPASDWD